MEKIHTYNVVTEWTGNTGEGTANYRSYERSLTVKSTKKVDILCTSDTAYNGDPTKHNPEELLLASISSCHMLWYLHLCAVAGVVVIDYKDHATASMLEEHTGGGRFTEAVLHPVVVVKDTSMVKKAEALHKEANRLCYIANSCNFPISHEADISAAQSV